MNYPLFYAVIICSIVKTSLSMDNYQLPSSKDNCTGGRILITQTTGDYNVGDYVSPFQLLSLNERHRPRPAAIKNLFTEKYEAAIQQYGMDHPYTGLLRQAGIRLGILSIDEESDSGSDLEDKNQALEQIGY